MLQQSCNGLSQNIQIFMTISWRIASGYVPKVYATVNFWYSGRSYKRSTVVNDNASIILIRKLPRERLDIGI